MDKMWILCLTLVHLSFASYSSSSGINTLPFNVTARLDIDNITYTNTTKISTFILNTSDFVFSKKFGTSRVRNTSEPVAKTNPSGSGKVNITFTGEIVIKCRRSGFSVRSCNDLSQKLNYILGETVKYREYFNESNQSNITNWPFRLAGVNISINCNGASTVKKCPQVNANSKSDKDKISGLGIGLAIVAAAGLLIAAGILYKRKCRRTGQVGSDYERKDDDDNDGSSSKSPKTDTATSENPFAFANMPPIRSDISSKTKFVGVQ